MKKRKGKKPRKLNIACWNMRSLVEDDGSLETARSRQDKRSLKGSVERKAVMMVWEFKRYSIFAAGISETKWFNRNIYEVEDHVILHSGRQLPQEGEPVKRGEGVGIVMGPEATKAWRDGGEQWEAVSSRIVSARLRLSGGKKPQHLSMVSVYAPTFHSPQQDKDDFYADLQRVIDLVPDSDMLVILGDWNARVGSNLDGVWDGVLGVHGLGKMNEAGMFLLSFCSMNCLSIMNTMYEKRDIHKRSWQHPGTKKWHSIDFILMRQSQRRRCIDVQVMRGADCWSDHKMVRAKLHLNWKPLPKKKGTGSRLLNMRDLREESTRTKFNIKLEGRLNQKWSECAPVQEKWDVLVSSTKEVAQEVLSTTSRKSADWFLECEQVIRPALEKRNQLLSTWLASNSRADRMKYVKQKSAVQRLVRQEKNKWFQEKAAEIEYGMNRSRAGWKSIRQLQVATWGMKPTTPRSIRNECGEMCKSSKECHLRWRNHFNKVLNVASSFDASVIEAVEQRELLSELDKPPEEDELETALNSIKSGKAGGKNGLTPELVKQVGCVFDEHLMELFKEVWKEGKVPQDWADAVLVAIPKKGDLSLCDNWRGISLLDVVGKVFAQIMKQRLQSVADTELAESQCGFRKGRGCIDMIFCARQVIEKSIEHVEPLYVVFVDLRKAYDSVPREAMWKVLGKYGIPRKMISLIQSFHENMSAELKVNGQILEGEISVSNGLRQGCTMAPTLFNLYLNLVVDVWRNQCSEDGITILFNVDGHLVGSRSSKFNTARWSELKFADDTAIFGPSRDKIIHAMSKLFTVTAQFGLTISVSKTKAMVVGGSDEECQDIQVGERVIEMVEEFKYLGSVLACNGSIRSDVKERVAKASRTYGCLKKSVFQNRLLTTQTKRAVYKAAVLGTLLYGSETWTTKRGPTQLLETFNNRCLRGILGITHVQQREERITSSQVRKKIGMTELIAEMVTLRRLRWLGHMARMSDTRMPKQALFGRFKKARPFHGVKMRWKDRVKRDLTLLKIPKRWYSLAQDRKSWYEMCQKKMKEKIERRLEQERRKRQAAIRHTIPHSQAASSATEIFDCQCCKRMFRRPGDLKRHKCDSVRSRKARRVDAESQRVLGGN